MTQVHTDGSSLKIHLVAACGTGMGTLACALKQMGHRVTGSDQQVYPPMSDFLKHQGVALYEGYDNRHINGDLDLVIIGNAVSKDNVEAAAVMQDDVPYLSMPQAVNRFVAKGKKIILVSGTHGKTTTSSLMAHILSESGLDPSFMVGGILKNYDSSFQMGNGRYMVIEGDEYDTAFFDKGPKFMHYDPEIAILTGIEFDHADIFTDIEHIRQVFDKFIKKIKDNSRIIAFDASEHLNRVLDRFQIPLLETYGRQGQWSYTGYRQEDATARFDIEGPGREEITAFESPLMGEHNVQNTLACIAAARHIGISDKDLQKALTTFQGVKRRQEIRGVKNGITVMDDFAHHPTAVRETINGVKPFYQDGRVIAVFEPRTNTSMRKFFQDIYPETFLEADMVCVCRPNVHKKIDPENRFSTSKLVEDINKKGVPAHHFDNSDAVVRFLTPKLRSNDLVLIMSNGGFDNIHQKLLEQIV